jgi:prepilin-type N-terminal cleavage/methylation domain-containing protein
MHRSRKLPEVGFTMIELLVAMVVTLVIMAGAVMLFKNVMQTSNLTLKRSEVQTEARAAISQMTRDLSQAGTGVPLNGIAIPSAGTGGADPSFACDAGACYTGADAAYTQGLLYKVTPGDGIGPSISEPSDAIKIVYVDPTLPWTAFQAATIAVNGSSLTMPAATLPAVTDPAVGVTPGDVLLLQNAYGSAIGVVTAAGGQTITFGADPLNINQVGAAAGNVKALATPKSNPVTYPATQVSRLMMVTYFIQPIVGPNGPDTRLMRQSGSHPPVPVAEHIEDLQLTYDLVDPITNALTSNSPDAVVGGLAQPNQIRKININVTSRAVRADLGGPELQRVNLTTSIGPRNLSFRDRYN